MAQAAAALFRETPRANKAVVVAAIVGQRLRQDGKWPPVDLTKVMGANYNYNRNTMRNFLAWVRRHLGLAGYQFDFDDTFILSALGMRAPELMGAIELAIP